MANTKTNSHRVDSSDIACRIQAIRLVLHDTFGDFSVEDVSRMSGVEVSTIQGIEAGAGISVRALAALAFVLGVKTDWIVGLLPNTQALASRDFSSPRMHTLSAQDRERLRLVDQFYHGSEARVMVRRIRDRLPHWLVSK